MNITYIILAIFYLFGVGTYALNQRKNSNAEIPFTNDNRIIVDSENAEKNHSDSCFVIDWINHSDHEKQVKKNLLYFPTFPPEHINKQYLSDCNKRTSYNLQLPDITRPSPVI